MSETLSGAARSVQSKVLFAGQKCGQADATYGSQVQGKALWQRRPPGAESQGRGLVLGRLDRPLLSSWVS